MTTNQFQVVIELWKKNKKAGEARFVDFNAARRFMLWYRDVYRAEPNTYLKGPYPPC